MEELELKTLPPTEVNEEDLTQNSNDEIITPYKLVANKLNIYLGPLSGTSIDFSNVDNNIIVTSCSIQVAQNPGLVVKFTLMDRNDNKEVGNTLLNGLPTHDYTFKPLSSKETQYRLYIGNKSNAGGTIILTVKLP